MGTTAAIIQSNYIPWKGYFDIINDVDVFVFEDDLQYTVRDWRNRNKIKTETGLKWLTVPVLGGRNQNICDVKIDYSSNWQKKHLGTIKQSYSKCEYFKQFFPILESILNSNHETLSELNHLFIKNICEFLGVTTQLISSTELDSQGDKDGKLIDICHKLGIKKYLSGPAGMNYIVPEKFYKAGIELVYKDYSGYPEYDQLHPPFSAQVSIIDLIFHKGNDAPDYIWGWRNRG